MSIAKNKAELVQLIKDWITTDNEIRELNKQAKQRKDKLKKVSQNLINTMKENDIDEFNVKDGKIMYSKTNVKKPIKMNNFILENREEVVKESIKRTIVNNVNVE